MAGMAAAYNHTFVVRNILGPINGCVSPQAAIGEILAAVVDVNGQLLVLGGGVKGIVVAPEFYWGKQMVYDGAVWDDRCTMALFGTIMLQRCGLDLRRTQMSWSWPAAPTSGGESQKAIERNSSADSGQEATG